MGKAQSRPEALKASQRTGKPSVPYPKVDMDFMIQPPDEANIKRSWRQLSSLIDSHVEEFYDGTTEVDHNKTREDLEDMDIFEDDNDLYRVSWLLHSEKYRKLGLRILIARAVLASIDFCGDPLSTSLDPHVVALMARFDKLHPDPSPEQSAALSQWRIITASFLAPESDTFRDRKLPCEERLLRFLNDFRSRSEPREQIRQDWKGGIATIVQRGIDIGHRLFCHPSTWSFVWDPAIISAFTEPSNQPTQIGEVPAVIFPALVEICLQDGNEPVQRPNMIQPAEIFQGLTFVTPEGYARPFSSPASPGADIAEHRELPDSSPELEYAGIDQSTMTPYHLSQNGSSHPGMTESKSRHYHEGRRRTHRTEIGRSHGVFVDMESNIIPPIRRRTHTIEAGNPPSRRKKEGSKNRISSRGNPLLALALSIKN